MSVVSFISNNFFIYQTHLLSAFLPSHFYNVTRLHSHVIRSAVTSAVIHLLHVHIENMKLLPSLQGGTKMSGNTFPTLLSITDMFLLCVLDCSFIQLVVQPACTLQGPCSSNPDGRMGWLWFMYQKWMHYCGLLESVPNSRQAFSHVFQQTCTNTHTQTHTATQTMDARINSCSCVYNFNTDEFTYIWFNIHLHLNSK